MKWFEEKYRRHLCDMHIEQWDNSFLSKFSETDYFNNIKRANVNSAMIYFQSHVGLCYFPTRYGYLHNAFKNDEGKMRRLVDICRKNGISVTGYYSLIYNNCAHDDHPTWRMVEKDGKSKREKGAAQANSQMSFTNAAEARYGLCCPNNMEYRAFVKDQIKEMLDYFDVDGMFYDMLYWPHICYCRSCRARWNKETGMEFPEKIDLTDNNFKIFIRKRAEWMGEFAQWVTNETKKINPKISVEHNVAATISLGWNLGCTNLVSNASDYAGGDLYGGMFEHSFSCKFYSNLTKQKPFEYMFSRCTPNLSKHTITKSEDVMRTQTAVTMAHHGATMVIDAINLDGTLNPQVYDRIGKVFKEEEKYEKYFKGEMVEDIGVYYTFRSKYNPDGEKPLNGDCAVNTVKNMIEKNILAGVCGEYCDISKYKSLIFPLPGEEDSIDEERITDYVKDGGILYFSGAYSKSMLKRFFDADYVGRTEENEVYIAPRRDDLFEYFNEKYPLPFDGTAPKIKNMKGEIYATITLPCTSPKSIKFASIHSNPPYIKTQMPAVAVTDYGKGKVIWSALPIESINIEEYKRIFNNLIFEFLSEEELSIISNAPKKVEITEFIDEKSIYINTVHLNDEYCSEEVGNFCIKVKISEQPKKVIRHNDEAEIDFTYEDNYVSFTISELKIFQLYEIIK